MSAPDEAMLSAQERAALAHLEARAVADDPRLASNLRGLRSTRRYGAVAVPDVSGLTTRAARTWAAINPMLWGPSLLVVGLVLIVVGLSLSIAVSLVGVAAAGVGMALLVQVAHFRIERSRAVQGRPGPGSSTD